jgi:hypothetical protein
MNSPSPSDLLKQRHLESRILLLADVNHKKKITAPALWAPAP